MSRQQQRTMEPTVYAIYSGSTFKGYVKAYHARNANAYAEEFKWGRADARWCSTEMGHLGKHEERAAARLVDSLEG